MQLIENKQTFYTSKISEKDFQQLLQRNLTLHEVFTKEEEILSYNLSLSRQELDFLYRLMTAVGGDPDRSARRIADRFVDTIEDVTDLEIGDGIEEHGIEADITCHENHPYWKEEQAPVEVD